MCLNGDMNNAKRPTFPNRQLLEAQPVICQGHDADLVLESGDVRIWLIREPGTSFALVESYEYDGWLDAGTYDANDPPYCVSGPSASLVAWAIPAGWQS